MKKKRFITFFILVSLILFETHGNVYEEVWESDINRSLSIILSIEEKDLHIYSDNLWNDISIEILNPEGAIIYTNRIDIPAKGILILSVADTELPKGIYQVILTKNNQPRIWYLTKS